MNSTPDWVKGGGELKADPAGLRGFATNVSTIAANLLSDANGPMMDLFTSTGSFPLSTNGLQAGQSAEELCSANQTSMQAFCGDAYKTLLADGSAFHTLADCYESGDGGNGISLSAVQWVYQEPGGKQPPNAPAHLFADGKLVTLNELYKQKQDASTGTAGMDVKLSEERKPDGSVVTTYQTSAGGVRIVTEAGGKVDEIVKDKNDVTLYTMSSTSGVTTTTFFQDNKASGSTVTTRTSSTDCPSSGPQTTHQKTTVEQRNANGEVIGSRTDHVEIKHNHETNTQTKTLYTTEGADPNKQINRRDIGEQPVPATPEDWQDLAETEAAKNRKLAGM